MKVFINKSYSGGLVIVVANNVEEAHKVLCFNYPFSGFFDAEGNCCNKEEAVFWSNFDYEADKWIEIPYLTANVTEPRIIEEDSYDR